MSAAQLVSLADVIESAQSGFAAGENLESGVAQIRMNNITTAGNLDWASIRRVSSSPQRLVKYSLVAGDVLFNHTNSPDLVGKSALFTGASEPIVFSNHFLRLRVNENLLDPRYFSRWLHYQWRSRVFERFCTQWVNQAAVRQDDLLNLQLALPPVSEQKRIAGILEKADRLRRTRRCARQLGDTFLQSVFLKMFDSFLTKEENEVLKNVLALPLSNGSFESNKLYGSGTPVIWVDNLYHTITIDLSHLRRARLSKAAIAKYKVLKGDLLFTRSSLVREGIGQINIVPKLPERTAFECHIIRARVDEKKVNPLYVLGLYRSPYGRNFIMRRANTATMTTISQTAIEELPCPIPPLPLQQKFAATVHRFERLRAQQREAERQAEHLFQTLLHRAFTTGL